MGTKLTLTDVTSGYASSTTINANNTAIENEFDNCLSLDGTAPNSMGADLDMNSNQINNLAAASTNLQAVNLQQLNAYAAGDLGTSNATAVSLVDTSGLYTAITVEGALAELKEDITVWDSGLTDNIAFSHNGTNAITSFTSTTSWDVQLDNLSSDIKFTEAGATKYSFSKTRLWLQDGFILRIGDPGDTDWVEMSHDGTDFNVAGTNTTDINITGITTLNVPLLELTGAASTFAPTVLTGFSANPTITMSYIDMGIYVILWVSANTSGTSNSASFQLGGLPAAIRPSSTQTAFVSAIDNGNTVNARLIIATGGSLTYEISNVSGTQVQYANSWTSSGSKGLSTYGPPVIYIL